MQGGTASCNANGSGSTPLASTFSTFSSSSSMPTLADPLQRVVPGQKRSYYLAADTGATVTTTMSTNTDADAESCCWSGRSENDDSMRPVAEPRRRRKRRRTTIVDAFNGISLQECDPQLFSKKEKNEVMSTLITTPQNIHITSNNSYTNNIIGNFANNTHCFNPIDAAVADEEEEDADSSQAIADERENGVGGSKYDDDCDTSTSSLEDDDVDDNDGGATSNSAHSSSGGGCVFLLNDMEVQQKEVERKVMLELVFGRENKFVPTPDPAERKLAQLLRQSLQQGADRADLARLDDVVRSGPDDISLSTASSSKSTMSSSWSMRSTNGSIPSQNQHQRRDMQHRRSNSMPEQVTPSVLRMDTVGEEGDEGSSATMRTMSMMMMEEG